MAKKHSPTSTPSKVLQQKESAAKIAAEKALTEKEAEMPAPSEPTLKERMEAIDRRARERAEQEKAALAGQYYSEKRAAFAKLIEKDEEIANAYAELRMLERMATAAGTTNGSNATADASGERKQRMDSNKLKEVGEAIVAALGKGELSGSEIAEKIGEDAEIVKAAIARLKREEKIKSNGMRGPGGKWMVA